ncbi:SpaH/EbpB family LPXTG-anchored major pilin [Enterococcus sp. UD-01]|jgi:fimbrial isopeptide formation D2 family protein/LPXTG-motif cell wall-anchored protein|uniref:SpaH/EbpB family LPXTG-anchored major pilin n=1 Tax=Enterococcus sp. UD-01 TaxID=3373911 RepID=UPI0038352EDC
MKKTVQKAISALFVLMSFVSLAINGVTAFADSLAPEKGSLTIHKYFLDNLSEAGKLNNNGKELASGDLPANAKIAQGVAFDVFRITAADTTGNTPAVPMGAGATYTKVSDTEMKVTYLDANNKSQTQTFAISKVDSSTASKSWITDNTGKVKLTDLDRGYYFVVENLTNSTPVDPATGKEVEIGTSVNPFVVAVPMVDRDTQDGWVSDVHVYPKNQPIGLEKKVNKPSVTVGDEVTYSIIASIPSDIAASSKFNIYDDLDAALNYQANSVKIYPIKADGTRDTALTTGFKLTEPSSPANRLQVEFDAAGRTALAAYPKVEVEFKAVANSKILEKADYTVPNQANVDYINSNGVESHPGSNVVKVITGEIRLDKKDDKGNALAGAQFQIALSEADAKAGKFLKKDANGLIVKPTDANYATANAWVETSAGNPAYVHFKGLEVHGGTLEAPADWKSYWIVETKAPAGFNLLGDAFEVTFSAADKGSVTADIYTAEKTVVNTSKFVLPETGGTGNVLLTVAGIIMVGLAGIILVSRKKQVKTR